MIVRRPTATALRTTARRLGAARATLRRLPPLLGASAREFPSITMLAMLVGDWPTVVEAARARLDRAPGDEGARVALMVGLWELGEEAEAARIADAALREGTPAGVRAAARYFHHLDDPAAAQGALDRLNGQAGVDLRLGMGRAWRRHGHHDRALADADAVLAADPRNAGARALRTHALAEQRVLDGAWAEPVAPAPIAPVPGRVLHLLQRSLPEHRSGSTYRTHYSVTAQAAAGLEPHVLTQPGFGLSPRHRRHEVEEHAGVPHHRLPWALPLSAPIDERLAAYVAAAVPVVEALRPAVLHPASDYVNALVALELGRRYGLPVVYEVRGFPEVQQAAWTVSRNWIERSRWRREVEAGCWRAADRVVTLAEVMKRHIVAHGVDPDRVTVVPNAVDSAAFEPVPADPALRASLGIAPGALVVGYISTLSPYEGLPYLVEAVARLTAQGRDVHAVIVGDGRERVHLGQLARRLGVGDRVTLTGRVDHAAVPAYYALMDVFVVPRTAEITCQLVTPLKPYEAMAAGRAVVVSRTDALAEMVIEGETGATFTPEDAEDLARVIARLDDDPAGRRALGARARAWVSEHRTWAGNAGRYSALYRELGAA
ncbi:MAG TPA: glycosyltransferase [Solirubrobacteraceae bacterium]|jgi:glycosyltransferase involved in cell wall biosynthesis